MADEQSTKSHRIQIIVALIGVAGALGAAYIARSGRSGGNGGRNRNGPPPENDRPTIPDSATNGGNGGGGRNGPPPESDRSILDYFLENLRANPLTVEQEPVTLEVSEFKYKANCKIMYSPGGLPPNADKFTSFIFIQAMLSQNVLNYGLSDISYYVHSDDGVYEATVSAGRPYMFDKERVGRKQRVFLRWPRGHLNSSMMQRVFGLSAPDYESISGYSMLDAVAVLDAEGTWEVRDWGTRSLDRTEP